jgi:hypothetical protein
LVLNHQLYDPITYTSSGEEYDQFTAIHALKFAPATYVGMSANVS